MGMMKSVISTLTSLTKMKALRAAMQETKKAILASGLHVVVEPLHVEASGAMMMIQQMNWILMQTNWLWRLKILREVHVHAHVGPEDVVESLPQSHTRNGRQEDVQLLTTGLEFLQTKLNRRMTRRYHPRHPSADAMVAARRNGSVP
jgi:hypothetical protein